MLTGVRVLVGVNEGVRVGIRVSASMVPKTDVAVSSAEPGVVVSAARGHRVGGAGVNVARQGGGDAALVGAGASVTGISVGRTAALGGAVGSGANTA